MEETCREGMELLKAAAAGDAQSPLAEVAEIEPVSYTHLDVYKRQAL